MDELLTPDAAVLFACASHVFSESFFLRQKRELHGRTVGDVAEVVLERGALSDQGGTVAAASVRHGVFEAAGGRVQGSGPSYVHGKPSVCRRHTYGGLCWSDREKYRERGRRREVDTDRQTDVQADRNIEGEKKRE